MIFLLGALLPLENAAAEDIRPLRVGFILPLSGPLAEFGWSIRNGVTLALQKDAELRRMFHPIYEDSRYDSKTAVSNFQKLRSVDRVQAVYVFGGPMSDTLAPVAERNSMPMFSTEYDVRYTRGKKYVFRFANNAKDYAEALLTELRARKLRRFGIIKVENQYHNTLSEALIESLSEGQEAKILFNFQPGDNDFRAVIAKLRAETFDALGVYLTPGMQHSFFSQLKPTGLRYPLLGTDSFESREENRGVEETVEGALFANSAVSQEFENEYQIRFNSRSQIVHAALAYEFTVLVGDLFKTGRRPETADEFIAPFALSSGRLGVCGEYFYRNSSETGQYFSFPIAVRQIKDGLPVVVSVVAAP
jgi:ABC-type branched-subunit amino acid transport system substrate-binding protein